MSAIFGFTFHIGRMTEVLTPDIYIELTGLKTPPSPLDHLNSHLDRLGGKSAL